MISRFICLYSADVLVVAESLSVDPYMRYLLRTIPLNTTVVGEQLAR